MANNIQLVITDLTQMPIGNRVCVAGIDNESKCYRLCWNDGEGVPKKNLRNERAELIIRPRAEISLELWPIQVKPPHVEDHEFNSTSIKFIGINNDQEWEKVLQRNVFNSLREMFDGYLVGKGSVIPGSRTRSLGTLIPEKITDFYFSEIRPPKPRLVFTDITGISYDRPISDLAVRNLCYKTIVGYRKPAETFAFDLRDIFTNSKKIYLRIGLARPWGNPLLCWTQVTGIYTFPDYLNGKTFADFE